MSSLERLTDGVLLTACGVQMTGPDGVASFRTIFPGWYTGRAVHVHLKVALGTTAVHTGQLFFDEATLAAAYASEPYAARGAPTPPTRPTASTARAAARPWWR